MAIMEEMPDCLLASQSDQHLLLSVARGDVDAFDELYQRYESGLYDYILSLVQEPAVAEDLLQEVFFSVWNGAHRFRGLSQVKTWLFHIAHNQAVSWLRTCRKAAALEELDEVDLQEDPEAQVMEAWRNRRMRQALDKLSPEHRAVVELAFFQQLSYREIAEVVGCPVGTVKSRMSFARRYLNVALADLIQDGCRSKV